ncbi:hypothetical protein [Streptomyces sp. NPDC046759]|uniref:hypothetical protein n=1 Tax=Streptomyces sp. NPDC046759 TaxID=3155019 RepID=UPI0033DF96AE
MNTRRLVSAALRTATATTLAGSAYIHAQLYVDEYRFIHVVGALFLLQAGVSFALAVLLLAGAPPMPWLRSAVAGVALGALGGFTASRTVGVFGFTEHGLQPAPQAVLSLVAEIGTLLFLALWQLTLTGRHGAVQTAGSRLGLLTHRADAPPRRHCAAVQGQMSRDPTSTAPFAWTLRPHPLVERPVGSQSLPDRGPAGGQRRPGRSAHAVSGVVGDPENSSERIPEETIAPLLKAADVRLRPVACGRPPRSRCARAPGMPGRPAPRTGPPRRRRSR